MNEFSPQTANSNVTYVRGITFARARGMKRTMRAWKLTLKRGQSVLHIMKNTPSLSQRRWFYHTTRSCVRLFCHTQNVRYLVLLSHSALCGFSSTAAIRRLSKQMREKRARTGFMAKKTNTQNTKTNENMKTARFADLRSSDTIHCEFRVGRERTRFILAVLTCGLFHTKKVFVLLQRNKFQLIFKVWFLN